MAEARMADASDAAVGEEYKIWKKNTPFLYDLVIAHTNTWPSLTAQWLPERKHVPGREYSTQQLILGTQTSGEDQNYLMIAEVSLPVEATTRDARGLDPNTQEVGGINASPSPGPSVRVVQRIAHEGDVNRARHSPHNAFLIATRTECGEVHVFDKSKHPSQPPEGSPPNPDLRLTGIQSEGFGLAWAPAAEGHLASCGNDGTVAVWNISENTTPHASIKPWITLPDAHAGAANDIAWHCRHAHMLGSVGDDRALRLWDTRTAGASGTASASVEAAESEVNGVAFSPHNDFLAATASSDGTVAIWDIRALGKGRLASMSHHKGDVIQVAWSPQHETVLASAGQDRRVMLWDLARIGDETGGDEDDAAAANGGGDDDDDDDEGPPELVMTHGGHTEIVADIAWNPAAEWVLATCAEDNILQIWQPDMSICMPAHA